MVRHDARVAAHCVYFPHDLPFGYATHCGVAAHLCYSLHIHCDKQHTAAHIGGGGGGFATSVSCAYYYYVIFVVHNTKIVYFGQMF
jgi:hypothetical protein